MRSSVMKKVSTSMISQVKEMKEPLDIAPKEKNGNFVEHINDHKIEEV